MWGEDYDYEGNDSVSRLLEDDEDAQWAVEVNRNITYYVTTPLAVIGVVLNCLVILTWRKYSSAFFAAIFLFKAIAVADSLFLAGFCLWYYYPSQSVERMILRWIAFASRNVLVNINFLMTLIRWIAVKFPFRFRSSFSAVRVRIALGIIIAYCGLVEFVNGLLRHLVSVHTWRMAEVVLDQVFLSMPLLVQFVLSISIVWITWKVSRKVKGGWINKISREKIGKAEMTERKKSAKLAFGRNRQLTAIIVSITLVTFVAYPLSNTISMYVKLAPTTPKGSFKRVVFACINLLTVFNSSINFFIYFRFMAEFRKNLSLLQCPCYGGFQEARQKRRPRKVKVSTENQVTTPTVPNGTELVSMFATPSELDEEFYQ